MWVYDVQCKEEYMSFYKDVEEMYNARAKRFKEDADRHWAMAKSGEGDYHYAKAKECYNEAKKNKMKAEESKGKSFGKKK